VLYCATMREERMTIECLASWLRDSGLGDLSAALLRGFRPLSVAGAQALHLLTPLLGGREGTWEAFAGMLEDPQQVDVLIDLLEQESDL